MNSERVPIFFFTCVPHIQAVSAKDSTIYTITGRTDDGLIQAFILILSAFTRRKMNESKRSKQAFFPNLHRGRQL